MSNKRSFNHQHHHFQIPINSQIDSKKLKSNLQHQSDDENPSQIDTNPQIDPKNLNFQVGNNSKEREDHSRDDGEEKFQMFMKQLKFDLGDKSNERETDGDGTESLFSRLDENLLYEILKHADARTLAMSSCVSKIWNRTAQDERLWELICTQRWIDVNHGGGEKQLRSVVLALGGFRRLYSLYLSKTAALTSTSTSRAPLAAGGRRGSKRWGKDEVNLSLSLLSIQFYEKMNSNNHKKGK